MRTVNVSELDARLGEFLAIVAAGESIEISSNGRPVARLVPIDDEFAGAGTGIKEWERYRDEHHVVLGGGITIRELIEEGRE